MPRFYNARKAKEISERNRKRAQLRWKLDRERRDAEQPARLREIAEAEIENLPRNQGDALGCLQWTDFRTGRVRRWVIRIGDRADRVTLESTDGRKTASHGWTWVMDHLRGFLAGRKR
jgi:hypothetical protein